MPWKLKALLQVYGKGREGEKGNGEEETEAEGGEDPIGHQVLKTNYGVEMHGQLTACAQ